MIFRNVRKGEERMSITTVDKETINMLAPIDNIFGTHEGRLGPVLKFLIVSIIPILIYIFFLQFIVPFKLVVFIEVLWTARMALYILGKEPEKYARYKVAKDDKYADAYSLIKIAHQYENCMIEYQNGKMAVLLTGFTATYFDDNVFANDLEKFLEQLNDFEVDTYCHMFVNEFSLQNNSEELKVYTDKDFMAERMNIYKEQDDYVEKRSKLYRYSFMVKASQYDWKKLIIAMNNLIESSVSNVFQDLHIASRDEFSDIASRDLGTYLSIEDMLRHKYINDEYDGSRVLWYGDKVPKEYCVKEEVDDVSKRRVMYVDIEEDE